MGGKGGEKILDGYGCQPPLAHSLFYTLLSNLFAPNFSSVGILMTRHEKKSLNCTSTGRLSHRSIDVFQTRTMAGIISCCKSNHFRSHADGESEDERGDVPSFPASSGMAV